MFNAVGGNGREEVDLQVQGGKQVVNAVDSGWSEEVDLQVQGRKQGRIAEDCCYEGCWVELERRHTSTDHTCSGETKGSVWMERADDWMCNATDTTSV